MRFSDHIDVSIIIVNYNTCQLVLECLDSIEKKTNNLRYEVIVVDNNSQIDETESLLKEDKRIKYVQSEENVGFGRANVIGAKHAKGKFLFFLNPDTILLNNAIKELHDFLSGHPNVGACGGNLYDVNLQPHHSFSRLHPSVFFDIDVVFRRFFSRLIFGKNLDFNYSGKPLEVAFVTGADLMIPQYVWDRTGGFSPHFFMYYEECDLERRIQKLGYSVYNIPNAKIIHLEGKSFKLNIKREKLFMESRFIYYYKYYGRFYNFISNIINLVFLYWASFIFRFVGNDILYEKYYVRLSIFKVEMKKRKTNIL